MNFSHLLPLDLLNIPLKVFCVYLVNKCKQFLPTFPEILLADNFLCSLPVHKERAVFFVINQQ